MDFLKKTPKIPMLLVTVMNQSIAPQRLNRRPTSERLPSRSKDEFFFFFNQLFPHPFQVSHRPQPAAVLAAPAGGEKPPYPFCSPAAGAAAPGALPLMPAGLKIKLCEEGSAPSRDSGSRRPLPPHRRGSPRLRARRQVKRWPRGTEGRERPSLPSPPPLCPPGGVTRTPRHPPGTYQLPAAVVSPGAVRQVAGPVPSLPPFLPPAGRLPSEARSERGGAERGGAAPPAGGSAAGAARPRSAPQRCRRRRPPLPVPPLRGAAPGEAGGRASLRAGLPGPAAALAHPAGRHPIFSLLYCCFRLFPEGNPMFFSSSLLLFVVSRHGGQLRGHQPLTSGLGGR